jgi:hypothetical protein
MEADCTNVTSPEGFKLVVSNSHHLIIGEKTELPFYWCYHLQMWIPTFILARWTETKVKDSTWVSGCLAVPVTGIGGNEIVLTATMAMGKLHLS